jgi:hypothetical protein
LGVSVATSCFICESTSRSCEGGRMFRVREMASGQERPGGSSTPAGRGGREEPFCAGAPEIPFEDMDEF